MKKFNLIKSLAVIACAMTSNLCLAQDLIVTVDGKPMKTRHEIEIGYEFEDFSVPGVAECYSYRWDPKIEASVSEGTADLTVTVTSLKDSEGFQLCWPDGCKAIEPNGFATSTSMISTIPSDLQIHKEFLFFDSASRPTAGGNIRVDLQCGEKSWFIFVKCVLAEASVDGNLADENAPVSYYTIDGIQVQNPTKGIFIERKGGKARLIRK